MGGGEATAPNEILRLKVSIFHEDFGVGNQKKSRDVGIGEGGGRRKGE